MGGQHQKEVSVDVDLSSELLTSRGVTARAVMMEPTLPERILGPRETWYFGEALSLSSIARL